MSDDYDHFDAEYLGLPRYAFSRYVGELTTPPSWNEPLGARQRWAARLGGVPADVSIVQVIVSGKSDVPVILTNLRVEVTRRSDPVQGPVVDYCECGDVIPERIITVDLDRSPPSITDSVDRRRWFEEGAEHRGDPIDFPYEVTRTSAEVFYLFVGTGLESPDDGCHCAWTAELSYSAGDRSGTVAIDDNGRPFEVTAVAEDADVYFSAEGEPLTSREDYYRRGGAG